MLALVLGTVAVGGAGAAQPAPIFDQTVLFAPDALEQSDSATGDGWMHFAQFRPVTSDDGTVAATAIGARFADGTRGAVYVFRPDGDGGYDEFIFKPDVDAGFDAIPVNIAMAGNGTVVFLQDRKGGLAALTIATPTPSGHDFQMLSETDLGYPEYIVNGVGAARDGTIIVGLRRQGGFGTKVTLALRERSDGGYEIHEVKNPDAAALSDSELDSLYSGAKAVLGFGSRVLVRVGDDYLILPLQTVGVAIPRASEVDDAGNLYGGTKGSAFVWRADDLGGEPDVIDLASFGPTSYTVAAGASGRLAFAAKGGIVVLAPGPNGYRLETEHRITGEMWGDRSIGGIALSGDGVVVGAPYLGFKGAWRSGALVTFRSEAEGGVSAEPARTCSAERNGTSVSVTWEGAERAESFVVYRSVNGAKAGWRGRVEGEREFIDRDRAGALTYSVVAVDDFQPQASVTCRAGGSAPSHGLDSCLFRLDSGVYDVTWDHAPAGSEVVIERSVDGSPWYWRGRVDAEAELFDDTARGTIVNYRVTTVADRSRSDAVRCSAASR